MDKDDDSNGIVKDDLRVILTRPSTIFGVPFEGVILNLTIITSIFIQSQNLLYWCAIFPVHGIFALICWKDPRTFELLALWLKTKLANFFRSAWYWRASTYSALPVHKAPDRASRRRFAKLKGK